MCPIRWIILATRLSPKVKELKLSLPSDYVNDSFVSFPYDSIFPMEHLVIYVNQLVKLLTLIMPQLRELRLEIVELVDGNWNSVIGLLKY